MNARQFLRFLLAGGIAAAVNFGSRIALGEVMPYVPSIIVAYLIGMATAFMLNRAFVFTAAGNAVGQQAWRFALVNLAAVVQTVLISLLFARVLFPWWGFDWQPETIAHAIGVAVPVLTSYFGHKYFSFAEVAREPRA